MKKLFILVVLVSYLNACDEGKVKINEKEIEAAGEKLQQTVEKGVDTVGAKLKKVKEKIEEKQKDSIY